MDQESDLIYYVGRLGRKTRLLQAVGLAVLVMTLVNFMVVAFQAQNYLTVRRDEYAYVETLPVSVSILCVAVVFLLVAAHEYMYRSALSEFEELSEELQSEQAGMQSSQGPEADERWGKVVGPPMSYRESLSLRIVLRTFGRSAALPLFPRSSAPTIFIVLNLLLMTLGLFLVP